MLMFKLLAHGGLGNWDESIFLGVSVIFILMMGVSWVRSRNIEPDFDEQTPSENKDEDVSSDHFKLN